MITGAIKFFEPSFNLLANGGALEVSSGSAAAQYAIDLNPITYWKSVGSSDSTTETLTLTLDGTHTISRLFLLDHNFKGFNIQYDVAGTWTDFTNVVGISGSLGGGIVESAFSQNTAYYEFTPVTTSKIRIRVTTAQVANAEKYVSQIVTTSEIGTFAGYPTVNPVGMDRNARMSQTLSGKVIVQKSIQTATYQIAFKNHPNQTAYAPDLSLSLALFDRDKPFLVWLCGGKFNWAPYTVRGFRLQDLFQMQVSKPFAEGYQNGVYVIGVSNTLELKEHV